MSSMKMMTRAAAWRALKFEFGAKAFAYHKSLRFVTRYEKFVTGTAVGSKSCFQSGKANFTNNNAKAGVLGSHYGIYTLALGYYNPASTPALADAAKVIQDSEVEVKVGDKNYIPRTWAAPYFVPWGNVYGIDAGAGAVLLPSMNMEAPIALIRYRPDENIEGNFYWNTAPAATGTVVFCLIGFEAHGSDQG